VESQIKLPMVTAYITATAEMSKDRKMDRTLLKKAGDVVRRILGTKEVGFYLMTEDAGEFLPYKCFRKGCLYVLPLKIPTRIH
jgi:hypothetical protein